MKRLIWFSLALVLLPPASFSQTSAETGAAKTIQPSQSETLITSPPTTALKIPAGTTIEIEVAYTVNSLDVKAGERISFRVLVPIVIDGVRVIPEGALVTARITQAKRGGHWGKAGKLAWSMEDVVAADSTRVPLAPEPASGGEKLWSLETKPKSEATMGAGSVKGTSHKGEVATRTIVAAAIFPPLAPLALMHGFRRGENAILREGRRFVVAVRQETTVKVVTAEH